MGEISIEVGELVEERHSLGVLFEAGEISDFYYYRETIRYGSEIIEQLLKESEYEYDPIRGRNI